MARFARYIVPNRAAIWAVAEEDPDSWSEGNFPFYLLHDLYEPRGNGGLSFFEISDDDGKLIDVAAALHFPKQGQQKDKIDSASFRLLTEDDIQRLGLRLTTTEGGTFDGEINWLHRELKPLTGPQAVDVAKAMFANGPINFSAREIAARIASKLKAGILNECGPKMLFDLKSKNLARIVYGPAE